MLDTAVKNSADMFTNDMTNLKGKKGLVIGIANDQSIAYGCAKAFQFLGAELAVTYLNDKAKSYVEPLAKDVGAEIFMPCDVSQDGQLDAVFAEIEKKWGKLDFVLHSIAFAPKDDLHGRLTDSSVYGFTQAMDISCHSFIRTAKLAEPLMTDGGTLMTMSYYGSQKVVQHYNIMGPVKAALEASVRYLAHELGPKGIRVHAISPGPMKTRAASGIAEFDALLEEAIKKAPAHQLATLEDVGLATASLATNAGRMMTGGVYYIDGGYNIEG